MWLPKLRIQWRENKCQLCGEPCGAYRHCRDCYLGLSVVAQIKREWERAGREAVAQRKATTDYGESREWRPARKAPPPRRLFHPHGTAEIVTDQLFGNWIDPYL